VRSTLREAVIFVLVTDVIVGIAAAVSLSNGSGFAGVVVVALVAGLWYGSIAGVILWLIYRAIRFAVKG
jgi:hypothetical protein